MGRARERWDLDSLYRFCDCEGGGEQRDKEEKTSISRRIVAGFVRF